MKTFIWAGQNIYIINAVDVKAAITMLSGIIAEENYHSYTDKGIILNNIELLLKSPDYIVDAGKALKL